MTNGGLKGRRRGLRQGGQSIRRAVAVLRTLAIGGERGVPMAEVVQATSFARPTVHRIVHVLIEEGIVERSERTGNYVVGRQVPELALARPSRLPLMVAAEPHLAAASAQLGDTLFLTVRTGFDTLCVARRIGSYPIQVLSIEVGVRRPLGVSSAGVAILAACPLRRRARLCSPTNQDLAPTEPIPRRCSAKSSLRAAGATICATSALCKERSRFRPGSGRRTASRPPRLRSPPCETDGPRRAIEVADVLVATARAIEAATPR